MTQPNDARARGLFLAVMAVAPERRDAFLATACNGDEELRRYQADVAAFRAAVKWHAGQRSDAIAELERALGTLDVAAGRRPILESTLASYKAVGR
jgi:hypothetical protein